MKKTTFQFLAMILAVTLMSGCSDDDTSSSAANGGGSGGASLGPSTQTGIVTHRDFQILYDPVPAEIFDADGNYIQKQITISVHADDINDLVVNGRSVNFATEWGTFIDTDSCILEDGRCAVTWIPGTAGTVPTNCLISFTAWTSGEEKFGDLNDNNRFDVGETFLDLEEPFLDINDNGVFDNTCNADFVCEAIDIVNFTRDTPDTGNGMHDPSDGLYNGSLCADVAGNPNCSAAATSTMIHTRSWLTVREPFDHDDNPDTDDAIICN